MVDYLGIAVHPNFEKNHFLYVYFTYENDGKLWNKILRITESENKLVDVETIFDEIPGSAFSNGGILKFGPDGKLYVGTGTGFRFFTRLSRSSITGGKNPQTK